MVPRHVAVKVSLIPQDHQDPSSRPSAAGCVLPAVCRARWALFSTSTTLVSNPRGSCAVRRLPLPRRSHGAHHLRHHCLSWFPIDSSCVTTRSDGAAVCWVSGRASSSRMADGCENSMVVCEERSANSTRQVGSNSAHADTPRPKASASR